MLTCCAGAAFNYKWYGLDAVRYDGVITGPTATDDLPLSVCAPDPQGPGKCVVMLEPEFKALRLDYLDTKNKLIACEKSSAL